MCCLNFWTWGYSVDANATRSLAGGPLYGSTGGGCGGCSGQHGAWVAEDSQDSQDSQDHVCVPWPLYPGKVTAAGLSHAGGHGVGWPGTRIAAGALLGTCRVWEVVLLAAPGMHSHFTAGPFVHRPKGWPVAHV
jgi:hypothetical protein